MKLIPGTLHIYPLNDYGAVEVGEHRSGRRLLLLRAAACELELREKDAGVCCSGERCGAQVSLCSAPFADSWRA